MKIVLSIILFVLSFTLGAQVFNDSLAVVSDQVPEVMESFGNMLQWFIYAIILISVVGLVRIWLVRRKGNAPSQTQIKDPKAPLPARKSFFSMPLVFILIMLAIVFWHTSSSSKDTVTKEGYSNFVARMHNGSLTSVQFTERDIIYADLSGKKYISSIPFDDARLVDSLLVRGIKVSTAKPPRWTALLSYALPFIVLIFFYVFLMRGMNSQNSKAFSFGKSKARLHEASKSKVTFKDVAGVDEAKEELQEIVEFLKDPAKFQRLGGRIPVECSWWDGLEQVRHYWPKRYQERLEFLSSPSRARILWRCS
jgi:hypothetical protein